MIFEDYPFYTRDRACFMRLSSPLSTGMLLHNTLVIILPGSCLGYACPLRSKPIAIDVYVLHGLVYATNKFVILWDFLAGERSGLDRFSYFLVNYYCCKIFSAD